MCSVFVAKEIRTKMIIASMKDHVFALWINAEVPIVGTDRAAAAVDDVICECGDSDGESYGAAVAIGWIGGEASLRLGCFGSRGWFPDFI